MGNDCYVNETFKYEIEHETGAITVTSSTEEGYSLLLETVDDLSQTLPSVFRGVIGEPLLDVETRPGIKSIWGDRIAFEKVWRIYLEAVTSKVVGEANVIHKVKSKDVWHEEDGLVLRVIGLGSDDVGLDVVNLLICPCGYSLIANAAGAVFATTHCRERLRKRCKSVAVDRDVYVV